MTYATRLIDESTHPDTALTAQQIIAAAAAVSHTHALADITDAGALAALDTVDAAQIDAAAVTAAKLATSNAADATSDGYVLSWDDTAGSLVWVAQSGGGGSSAWGGITGTLSDQTDLQTALDAKAASSHTHTLSDVTDAGTLAGLNAIEAAQITTSNAAGAPTDGYVLSYDHTAGSMVWISAGSPGAHTHTLSDITDAGTLAGLNSVDSAQIAADAITPAKLETYNAKDGTTDGYVVSYDHTLGAFVLVAQSAGGSIVWGDLTGTLSDQTDLQTALDAKAASSHTHTLSNITDSGALAALDFVSTGDIGTGAVDTNQLAAGAVNTTKLDTTNEANYGTDGYVLSWNDTAGQMTWIAQTGGSPSWGSITGTLSNQTDLQTALDGKASTSHNHDGTYAAASHTHTLSDVTDAGTLAGLNSVDTAQLTDDAVQAGKLETYNEVDATTDGYVLSWDNTLGSMVWVAQSGGGGSPSWGSITGTLSNQTDLQTALDGKAASSHTHTLSDITDAGALAALDTVGEAQLEVNAVTAGIIANGAVSGGKIASNAVTVTKIADSAITKEKIKTNNGPSDGMVLSWDNTGSTMRWVAQAGGSPAWGSITGTLSDQTDLQTALDAKAASSHTHTLSDITDAGTLAYLSLIDSAQLATGAVTPDKFATWNAKDATTDGYVLSWNNSNSSFELVAQSGGAHTHTLSDITDAGTLAGLNSVNTAKLTDDAVKAAKIETYNEVDATTDGYVLSWDNTLGAMTWAATVEADGRIDIESGNTFTIDGSLYSTFLTVQAYSGSNCVLSMANKAVLQYLTGDVRIGAGVTGTIELKRPTTIETGAVSDVGLGIELQPSHTGNPIEVNTNGGSGGDVFAVTAAGQIATSYAGTTSIPAVKIGSVQTGISASIANTNMEFIVGGNVRATIGTSGFRSGSTGSEAGPGFAFTGYTSSGMYIDSTTANNPVAISHGGHRIARFNQYTGTKFEQRPTGTANPAVEIIVQGSGAGAALAITDTTTGDMVSIEQNGDATFNSRLQIDDNATAGQTRLLLWDVDSGSLRRVGVYNDGTRDLLYLV